MNMCIHILALGPVFNYFRYIRKNGMQVSIASDSLFNKPPNQQLNYFTFSSAIYKSSSFSMFANTCDSSFYIMRYPSGCEVLYCDFEFHLMASDVKHLFICLLYICLSWRNVYIQVLCSFLIGFLSLLLTVIFFIYSDTNPY